MRSGTVWQDEFSRRLLGIAMLVRLLSILMAFVGLVGEPLTMTVLACSLAMGGASLALLLSPAVASFVARHPLVCVTDVLLSLAVIALVGVESPLVIATMSSALVVGSCSSRWSRPRAASSWSPGTFSRQCSARAESSAS
ncbi:hypothetical protein NKG05_16750 [Oerskovia sp. M15]